jgi:F0F1-type ATP synthase assembly protein I
MEGNSLKYYARFSAIAAQMGGTIFVGAYFGKWLDGKYPMEKKWFTIVFTLLSVTLALISVLRQVNKINKELDERKKEESKKFN